jgi:hypothetical protein
MMHKRAGTHRGEHNLSSTSRGDQDTSQPHFQLIHSQCLLRPGILEDEDVSDYFPNGHPSGARAPAHPFKSHLQVLLGRSIFVVVIGIGGGGEEANDHWAINSDDFLPALSRQGTTVIPWRGDGPEASSRGD